MNLFLRKKWQFLMMMSAAVLISFFGFERTQAEESKSSLREISGPQLLVIEGEIAEVEELKEPKGSALFRVKDFVSGELREIFVDLYRTSIRIGNEAKTPHDVLPGSKATVIYEHSKETDRLEAISVKIRGSY